MTMSIGFSSFVFLASTIAISGFATAGCSLIACSVISPNGVEIRGRVGEMGAGVGEAPIVVSGSGEADGSGVGRATVASDGSSAIDARAFLFARTPTRPPVARFRGDAFLTGDDDSEGATLSGGLNIWDGSTASLARVRRARVAVCGVEGTSTVLRLVDCRVLRGAGGKSSSLSSLT